MLGFNRLSIRGIPYAHVCLHIFVRVCVCVCVCNPLIERSKNISNDIGGFFATDKLEKKSFEIKGVNGQSASFES